MSHFKTKFASIVGREDYVGVDFAPVGEYAEVITASLSHNDVGARDLWFMGQGQILESINLTEVEENVITNVKIYYRPETPLRLSHGAALRGFSTPLTGFLTMKVLYNEYEES